MKSIQLIRVFCVVAFAVACSAEERIVGGESAAPGQFPYMVSLRTLQNEHFCGAAIISNRWIISAARCTHDKHSKPANIAAWVGAQSRTDGIMYRVDSIVNYPGFVLRTLLHDICLIRTATKIQFIPNRVYFISLPTGDLNGGGRFRAVITGWGLTKYPSDGSTGIPQNLQFKITTAVHQLACRRFMGAQTALLHRTHMCSMPVDRKGTCHGDAGSPLIIHLKRIVGVNSWAIQCGRGTPDVYTRVFPYLNFIRKTTGIRPQQNI